MSSPSGIAFLITPSSLNPKCSIMFLAFLLLIPVKPVTRCTCNSSKQKLKTLLNISIVPFGVIFLPFIAMLMSMLIELKPVKTTTQTYSPSLSTADIARKKFGPLSRPSFFRAHFSASSSPSNPTNFKTAPHRIVQPTLANPRNFVVAGNSLLELGCSKTV